MSDAGKSPEGRGYRDARVVFLALAVPSLTFVVARTLVDVMFLSSSLSHGGIAALGSDVWQTAKVIIAGSTVAALLAYVAWVRRIVLNSRALLRFGTDRSAWAGLWLFVPLVNAAMPYYVMRDLWNSAHGIGVLTRDGRAPNPPLVLAWWWTFIGAILWAMVVSCAVGPPVAFRDQAAVVFIRACVNVSVVLFVMVARSITRAQVERLAESGLRPDEVPPRRG